MALRGFGVAVACAVSACGPAPERRGGGAVTAVTLDPGTPPADAIGTALTLPLDGLAATETARGTIVSLPSDITFDPGEASIRRAARPTLDRLAAAIRARRPATVAIEGHSDEVGGPIGNQRLSERRATAVRDYLTRVRGIDPTILTVRGLGASRPVASNDSAAGRARNRRVEVVLAS